MSTSHLPTTPSRSPRYSLTPGIPRSPLSERSDSDTNKIAPLRYDKRGLPPVENKTTFPRSPSLVSQSPMSPSKYLQYIFEDDTAGPSENLIVPTGGVLRSQRSSGNSSLRGPRPQPSSEKFSDLHVPPLFTSPNLSESTSSNNSAPRIPRIRELRPSGEHLREVELFQHDPLPLPPRQLIPRPSATSLASSASSETLPLDQLRSGSHDMTGRPRSHTATSTASRLVIGNWPQFDTASSVGVQDERRRSSSSPEAPSGALLQVLKANGTNVQYPEMRQVSNSNLRANVTGAKPLYSQPLKIRKKRAYSHLSREASMVNESQYGGTSRLDSVSSSAMPRSIRADQSFISNETSYMNRSDRSESSGENWRLERDDNVGELRAPPLRHQRSARQLEPLPESRPASAKSSGSHVGSLYNFLNDSVNTWARFYYRGDAQLPQESPPVERVAFSPPKQAEPTIERAPNRKRLSTARSGRSDSPASVGFPDSLYIARSRALRKQTAPRQDSNVVVHEESIFSESMNLGSAAGSTAPEIDVDAIEVIPIPSAIRAVPQSEPPLSPQTWSGTYNATPHLTVDKHMSMKLPNWRTPSFDETEGLLSRNNRQILLFCIGFVFPLAWFTAAFLPLHARPQWREKTQLEHVPEDEATVDLFNSVEVVKWQKARWWRNLNRFMSIAGIFIIAAVVACAVVATHARATRS